MPQMRELMSESQRAALEVLAHRQPEPTADARQTLRLIANANARHRANLARLGAKADATGTLHRTDDGTYTSVALVTGTVR